MPLRSDLCTIAERASFLREHNSDAYLVQRFTFECESCDRRSKIRRHFRPSYFVEDGAPGALKRKVGPPFGRSGGPYRAIEIVAVMGDGNVRPTLSDNGR